MISATIVAFLLPVSPQISASAGVSANVQVSVPTIHFEVEPPLVVVTPGVYVVQDYDQEVFFVRGYYWCNMGGVWYRTRHHRGGWVAVNGPRVPRSIYRLPPGHYKHYSRGPVYRPHRGRVVMHHGGPAPGRVVHVRNGGGGRDHRFSGGRGGGGHHGRHRKH